MSPPLRLIVTGTDTDIGKTVFSAGLAAYLGWSYWKPVQAGLEDGTDKNRVAQLAALPPERLLPEAWRLKTPASPHLAARLDGVAIDPDALDVPAHPSGLVIEGAGGVMVPLTDRQTYLQVFARWQLPVILVARTQLGTINHSLLSLEALRRAKVPVLGLAFIGPQMPDTESIIAQMGQVDVLGRLPILPDLTPKTLLPAFADSFGAGLAAKGLHPSQSAI